MFCMKNIFYHLVAYSAKTFYAILYCIVLREEKSKKRTSLSVKLNNIVPVLRMNLCTHASVIGKRLVDVRSWVCVCTVFIMKIQFVCDTHKTAFYPKTLQQIQEYSLLILENNTRRSILSVLNKKMAGGKGGCEIVRALNYDVIKYYGRSGSVLEFYWKLEASTKTQNTSENPV